MIDALRPHRSITGTAWLAVTVSWTVAVLLAWSLSSVYLVPSPLQILYAMGHLIQEDGLLFELWSSLRVNLAALAISTCISLALSYLTVVPAFRPAAAIVGKARFFGLAGFVVVFTLAFGGGTGLKIALLTFGGTVFQVTSMAAVMASIPKAEFDQARSLRMSEWRIVWEVDILGRADEGFEVVRQNAAMGWVMLTVVEGLVRQGGGAGVLMIDYGKHFMLDKVFAIQLSIFALGVAQDFLISWLQGVLCPYSKLTLERQ